MNKFDKLVEVMAKLRDPKKGCPWDKKQTPESIRSHMIEEVYEVCEAISLGDDELLKEELGDLLLHIVFQAQMAKEKESFDIEGVLGNIIKKLKRRHPHIFGDSQADTAAQVEENWIKIKRDEKKHRKSLLSGLPKELPALIKANRLQGKAANVGFDWENTEDTYKKLKEELREFEEELENNDKERMADEMGDLLFAMVNVARKLEIDPEFALHKTISKFIKRFQYMEDNLQEELFSSDLEKLEHFWEKAKDEV